ncbi:DapH/DapD/GlmU-related protein [Fusobacterium pseudoperiodonticum]|uniref:DapH/DapD/GlmU-related protein n=1 Tax=Fusobacterium pseudoperiodonticum TaxID=2663009 RepID=UPI001C9C9B7B|nr:DapH/DapD/GlmU-related protein [Fusobacterium pseudoperiodonticum]
MNHIIDPVKRRGLTTGKIHIKRNVWLGANVAVLTGATIGENSIVAANSVVTKDIPANVIVAGNPAKIIKEIKI